VARLLFSALARADIDDIWLFVARQSGIERADTTVDRLIRHLNQLCDYPYSGPERPDIAADARSLAHQRWLALYRVDADAVRILRIVDATRDLLRLDPEGQEGS